MSKKNNMHERGFLMMIRGDDTVELMKSPNVLMLLLQIAYRARRNDEPNVSMLKSGEAFIGDYRSIGLTEAQYRSAKKRLKKLGLATFKGTNKGTIAKLTDKRIFNINEANKNEQIDSETEDESILIQRQARRNKENANKKEEKKVYIDELCEEYKEETGRTLNMEDLMTPIDTEE